MQKIKNGFRRYANRAGPDGLRSYDLRHTFATRLVERGVHEYVISALPGHELHSSGFTSTSRMTAGYAHVTWDAKVNAVTVLESPAPKVEQIHSIEAEIETEFDKSLTNDEKLQKSG